MERPESDEAADKKRAKMTGESAQGEDQAAAKPASTTSKNIWFSFDEVACHFSSFKNSHYLLLPLDSPIFLVYSLFP